MKTQNSIFDVLYKRLPVAALLFLVASSGVIPLFGAKAQTPATGCPYPAGVDLTRPAFNIFTPYTNTAQFCRDYFLLDFLNATTGAGWNKPISANPGDTVVMSVYYHNGVRNTVARNTKIKVNFPDQNFTGANFNVNAKLWADNAQNATAFSPLQESGSIFVSQNSRLVFDQSYGVKLFDNGKDWKSDSPSRVFGSELFSSGINIGDIQGCFEFSGYIIFKAKVVAVTQTPTPTATPTITPTPTPTQTPINNPFLSINKSVRNVSANDTTFEASTNAFPGDMIAFQITVNSTGQGVNHNAILQDILPSGLNFISGSTSVNQGNINGDLFGSGLNLGDLSSGSSRVVTFQATVSSGINPGFFGIQLQNTATVFSDEVKPRNATANVFVQAIQQGFINIQKTVRNLTTGSGAFAKSVNAAPGDNLEFQLQIQSLNGSSHNVRVTDFLPSRLDFTEGSVILDGSSQNNDLISNGINIGSLNSGQSSVIIFRAQVVSADNFSTGSAFLNNSAKAQSSQNTSQDSASIIVFLQQQQNNTTLSIQKTVRNITQNSNFFETVGAQPDNIVEFKITTQNTGSATAQNVVINDSLPSQLILTNGNTQTNLGNLNPGESRTIFIQARVNPSTSFINGITTLTNTAVVFANNAPGQNDTAQVAINVESGGTPPRGTVLGAATVKTGISDSPLTRILLWSALLSMLAYAIIAREALLAFADNGFGSKRIRSKIATLRLAIVRKNKS